MKKILVICEFYLPSANSGGGMWTVVNLVETFADRYEFSILTRNYDSVGDRSPYTQVATDQWNERENCRVYYASNSALSKSNIARVVAEADPDCILLSGAFSTPIVRFLMTRRDGLVPDVPVIVAPIGSFASGALATKSLKKRLFLAYAKLKGLYRNALWKASTELEADEIRRLFGDGLEIMVAPDLSPKSLILEESTEEKPAKTSGAATFVFLSRIVPKKNLKFLLERVLQIREGAVRLEIVGPREDPAHWKECLDLIRQMPPNVRINVVGAVAYSQGLKRLRDSHFFVLPTLNENFGYVFIESLAVGTPIMISDQTVWGDAARRNAGWVTRLDDIEGWNANIARCVGMAADEYRAMSSAAQAFAKDWISDSGVEDATARLLERALASGAIGK